MRFKAFKEEKRTSKNKLTKGAFGKQKIQPYETLRVLPRKQQTLDNCNSYGVSIINQFKMEKIKFNCGFTLFHSQYKNINIFDNLARTQYYGVKEDNDV